MQLRRRFVTSLDKACSSSSARMQRKYCLDSGIISLICGRNKITSLHPMGPIPSVSIRSVGLGPRINEISRDDRQMSRDKDYLRVPA